MHDRAPAAEELPIPAGIAVVGESASRRVAGARFAEGGSSTSDDEIVRFRSPDGAVNADIHPARDASSTEREVPWPKTLSDKWLWLSYPDQGVGRWT